MKTTAKILLQIALILFLGSSATASDENKTAWVVVEHWPPWEIALDAKKEKVTGGLAVEIVKVLANRLNIKTEFENVVWKFALRMIKAGRVDIIPMIVRNPEREAYMHFTVPVYEDEMLFVYSADMNKTFEWERWEDLKPFNIGITSEYNYPLLRQAIKKHNLSIEEVKTDKQNILKLLLGRIDITPLYHSTAVAMFEEIPGSEKLRFSKKRIANRVFRFGISKKSFLATRVEEINNILQEMQDDGTFQNILGKYHRGQRE